MTVRRGAGGGLRAAVTLLLLAGLALPAQAETARELLDKVRVLNDTTRKWTDRTQKLRLEIIDRRGNARARDLEIYLKKYPDDANRSIIFFDSPPEIKGTAFLQWANAHTADEQWLYLPELKRVRRISGGSKRESFVGTDFSYEDLAIIGQITEWSEADAHAVLLRDEPIDGSPAAVIEFTPAGKDVAYGKIRVWLRRSDLVMVKFEFVDQKGRVAKVLTIGGIKPVGSIPTAFHYDMRNVLAGSHTRVEFLEVKYDTGLSDDAFTQRALERGEI
jgi:outer membrane lipoprotein-sorting protein